MLVDPGFGAADLEAERSVILEELAWSADTPDDLVHQILAESLFPGHSLGWEVLGIYDGYAGLLPGGKIRELTRKKVRMIHFMGGIILNTSRTNLSRTPENLDLASAAVKEHGIDMLVTIGGDDTAFGASELARAVPGLQIVHCPKTIDNDLPLPGLTPTFGYNSARHLGTQQVQALLEDAWATNRWYIAVAMGRTAGHLALGIGKAAAATVTLVPEEFGAGPIKLKTVVDTLVGGTYVDDSVDKGAFKRLPSNRARQRSLELCKTAPTGRMRPPGELGVRARRGLPPLVDGRRAGRVPLRLLQQLPGPFLRGTILSVSLRRLE